MSTLYIRLASKATADSVANWLTLPCPYAQASSDGAVGRQGVAPLTELSGAIATAQRVVLLLAASDVTLLRVKVPPLSPARMKAALPNLVEDYLITNPDSCVVVAGDLSDGLRTVAVVQRAWLAQLSKALSAYGAKRYAAIPAQLCLTPSAEQPGSIVAAVHELGAEIALTLRLSEQECIGLLIKPVVSPAEADEQHGSAAHQLISALCAVVAEAPIALYVPSTSVLAYQDAIKQNSSLNARLSVFPDNWSRWVAGARSTTLDMMAGSMTASAPLLDWRAWRWPIFLSVMLLASNAAALNLDWWHMKSEANALRTTMIQVYKTAYPKETVILDPIAQIRQKIAASKHDSGLAAADDFTMLTAAFGEAWAKVMPPAAQTSPPAITAIEYRERSLYLRLRSIDEKSTQQIQAALAMRKLSLTQQADRSDLIVWQIHSAK